MATPQTSASREAPNPFKDALEGLDLEREVNGATVEKTLLNDLREMMKEENDQFDHFQEEQDFVLFTGEDAWKEFKKEKERSFPELLANRLKAKRNVETEIRLRNFRDYLWPEDQNLERKNDMSQEPRWPIEVINAFDEGVGQRPGFKPLAASLASYFMAYNASRHFTGTVHVLFSKQFMAQVAPSLFMEGHMHSFELYPLTSPGTKVQNIVAWDVETFKDRIQDLNYEPRTIWEKGWGPLGKYPDFGKNPKANGEDIFVRTRNYDLPVITVEKPGAWTGT
jgi:hypothetical protein